MNNSVRNWKKLTTPREECKIYCEKCGDKWRSEYGWLYDDSPEAMQQNKLAVSRLGPMLGTYLNTSMMGIQTMSYLCNGCASAVKKPILCKSCGQTDHSRKSSKKCLNYVAKAT
jgi:hypothetical protein